MPRSLLVASWRRLVPMATIRPMARSNFKIVHQRKTVSSNYHHSHALWWWCLTSTMVATSNVAMADGGLEESAPPSLAKKIGCPATIEREFDQSNAHALPPPTVSHNETEIETKDAKDPDILVQQQEEPTDFGGWVKTANGGKRTTLRQEVELAVDLFVQACCPQHKMKQEEMVEKVLRVINDTPFGGESLVSWQGVQVGWFLNVFCSSPYMQRLRDFGCQAWFVRKVGIIVMMTLASEVNNKECPTTGTVADNQHLFPSPAQESVVQEPKLFISYTGAYTWEYVVRSLQRLDPKEVIWLDIVCVNQFAWTKSERSSQEEKEARRKFMDDLDLQILAIGRTALVMGEWDKVMDTLGQMWVLWEIYLTASSEQAELQVLFAPEQERDFLDNYMEKDAFDYKRLLAGIDANSAVAADTSDRHVIFSRMQKAGLITVNEKVLALMRDWLLQQCKLRLQERRSEPGGPATELVRNVALLLHHQGQLEDAAGLYREALGVLKQQLGKRHPDTLSSMNGLGNVLRDQGQLKKAELMYREALEAGRQFGNQHPDTLSCMNNLATVLHDQGNLEEAEELHREAVEGLQQQLGTEHRDTLASMNNLANVLSIQAKLDKAEPLVREVLRIRQRQLGSQHPDTLTTMTNLANVLRLQGKLEEAEDLFREALDIQQQPLGSDHPDTLSSKYNLATVLRDQGKLAEAERLHRDALEGRKRLLGSQHPDTLSSRNNLAVVLRGQGRLEASERLHRDALEGRRQHLGNQHPDTLSSMNNLAAVLCDQGKLDEAERLHRQTFKIFREQLGDAHPNTLVSMDNLTSLLYNQGKLAEAEQFCRDALEIRQRGLGNQHPITLQSMNNLVAVLRDRGKLAEAQKLRNEAAR